MEGLPTNSSYRPPKLELAAHMSSPRVQAPDWLYWVSFVLWGLLFAVLGIVIWRSSTLQEGNEVPFVLWAFSFFLFPLWVHLIAQAIWRAKMEAPARARAQEEAMVAAKQCQLRTVEGTRDQLIELSNRFLMDVKHLLGGRDMIHNLCDEARHYYDQRAYSLMFDRAHEATQVLEWAVDYGSTTLTNMQTFRDTLGLLPEHVAKRVPEPQVGPGDLPSYTEAVQELQDTIMMAHTTPEATMIWEQRRTQGILIRGFDSLAKAVQSLGQQVEKLGAAMRE